MFENFRIFRWVCKFIWLIISSLFLCFLKGWGYLMIVGYWISIILTTFLEFIIILLSSVLVSTILDFKYIDRFSRWWRGTHRLEDYYMNDDTGHVHEIEDRNIWETLKRRLVDGREKKEYNS